MFGVNHPSTISKKNQNKLKKFSIIGVWVNLATVLRDLKDYQQSIEYFEIALQARKELEGDESHNYAMALAMSAGSYRLNNDTDTAYKYLKEAYLLLSRHYKGEHWLPWAVVLGSMGLLYKQTEKYDRAIDAYERWLKVREKILGPMHPDTLAVRHNLGNLHLEHGKHELGKEILEQNVKYMDERNEQQHQLAHELEEKQLAEKGIDPEKVH